jgi:threonine dehydrogenase-like Zn-dependent dehydrogenase
MQAVTFPSFEEFAVVDVPRDEPGEGEVLVEVERVQLSVTECELFRGIETSHYETVRRRMDEGEPRLFGHEFCGRVVGLGAGVSEFAVGDRVYAAGKVPCHACAYCERGFEHLCSDTRGIGFDMPGGLSEFVALPAEPLRRLPDGVSAVEGAAMQPLASAVLCVVDADVEPGETVVVVGTGVMGFQCAQLARRFGAGTVYAVDVRERALELAAEHGLVPLDASDRDVVEVVDEETNGLGADLVIEAVGGDQTHGTTGSDPLAQAYRMVRKGGRVLQVGHISGDVAVTPRQLRSKSVRWLCPRKGVVRTGPNVDTGDLAPQLVAAGDVSIEALATHELDGLDAVGEAVDITLNKADYGALGPAQIVL